MLPGILGIVRQQATFLFQWLSLCLLLSNFPYIFPLYVCVDMGQTVTDIEYDVKLRMCISAISALRFLQQSNCPPMFTSTKVACLHFARYNSVCYILNYLVLIRMLLHYGEPIVLMKVLHFCAFIFKLIFHLQVLLCSLLWTSLTIEVHPSSVTEACWGHCNVQWYKVQTCSLQLSYCIYSLSWIFYWHRHMSSPCIYIIRVWQQIHFSRYS